MASINRIIQLHFLTPCSLSSRGALKAFLIHLFKKQQQPLASLTIIFCNDKYMLRLNRQFLHHDTYTDILSFPLSEPGQPLEAEIYISIERVRENAIREKVSFKQELHRVIFHGALHFCGFKDKHKLDIKRMRVMEDKSLETYFSKNQG